MSELTIQTVVAALSHPPACYVVAFHLAYLVVAVSVAAFTGPVFICCHFILTFILTRLAPNLPMILARGNLWNELGFDWDADQTPDAYVALSWSAPILVTSICALVVLLVRVARLMVVAKRAELKRYLATEHSRNGKRTPLSSSTGASWRIEFAIHWILDTMQTLWILLATLWSSQGCLDTEKYKEENRELVGPHGLDHSTLDYSRHGYNWKCPEMDPTHQSPVHVPEALLSCNRVQEDQGDTTELGHVDVAKSSGSMSTASDSASSSDLNEWAEEVEKKRSQEQRLAHRTSIQLKVYSGKLTMPLHRSVHEIRVNDSSLHENKMILDGTELRLAQFHFHSPAEHILLRENFGPVRLDAEVHFVFADHTNAPRAVIGYLLETAEDGTNSMLEGLLQESRESDEYTFKNGIIAAVANAADPERLSFVSYDGSLTTPPCSGPIKWLLSHTTMSPAQFKRLRILQTNGYGGNWRAPQEMFCRKFSEVKVRCLHGECH